MNISELTDEQVDRLMLWLYPERALECVKESEYDYYNDIKYHNGYYYCQSKDYEVADLGFDFTEDFNLTMPLAIKAGISLDFARLKGVNPLRDICEILIHGRLGNEISRT